MRVVHPCGTFDDAVVEVSTSAVPVHGACPSVYDTVELFERDLLSTAQRTAERVRDRIPLRSVINLHNDTGIRSFSQIVEMMHKVESGEHICQPSGLPNMKLVRTESGDRVLFDGHHSMLAYMACGRKYLDEVPHLIVSGEQGHVSDQEILVFFGPHAWKLRNADWKEYVINWEAPKDEQLCRRVQNDMGELFDRLVQTGALPIAQALESGPTKQAT